MRKMTQKLERTNLMVLLQMRMKLTKLFYEHLVTLNEAFFFGVVMVLLLVMMLQMLQRLEKMNLMILLLTRIWLTRLFCIHLATF